jgi:protein BUR2
VAATSLFLATKVEEHCRKVRELVIACCRVAQKNPTLIVDENTKDYWRWRDTIILNEDVLLELLCFDLTVESPYNILFRLLQYYGVEKQKKLRDSAWSFINDSFLTQACLLFRSREIAVAAVWYAARQTGIAFSDSESGKPWWEVQKVPLKQLKRTMNYMADFYANAPNGMGLKQGGESVYVSLRSPLDGDDDTKTRLMKEQTPVTPVPMEGSGSEVSVKREREEDVVTVRNRNGDVPVTNGTSSSRIPAAAQPNGESPTKKVKLDNGSAASALETTITASNGHPVAPEKEEDAGSEEGEVEE